jgi:hypothetical protein
MKVSELEGGKLDYWVARAEGMDHETATFRTAQDKHRPFTPSSSWADGGPIIESEDYCLPRINTNVGALHHGGYASSTPGGFCFYGNTPLIASMRAYVATRFGEEVPDEIAGQQGD